MSAWRLLTEGMITNPGYPWTIQLPHAVAATGSFRRSFTEDEWEDVPLWHRLIGAYFCHGYGASCLRDLLLGLPPSLVANPTVPWFFLLGCFLSYCSPGDVVYRLTQRPRHPLRLLMLFGETVDATTTVLGAFEKTALLQPGCLAAPYACAFLVSMGGATVRHFERKGRGWPVKAEWTCPTGIVQRGVVHIAAYALLRRLYGAAPARLWVTLLSCAVVLWAELSGDPFDPAARCCDAVLERGQQLRLALRLGPPSRRPGAVAGPRSSMGLRVAQLLAVLRLARFTEPR